jgi:hypothetical protein
VESADITAAGFDPILTSLRPSREPDWSLPVNRAGDWMTTTRSFRLPIPGVGEVRARSFLVILFVFAVLVGPANFAFLKRRGRQALLVLTAPLVSLAFVLLLGIYVVAAEGFGVHTRVASLTILDQARQQSVTRAVVSSYAAGRAPSSGLSFSRDTAVFPVTAAGLPETLELDYSRTQHFTEGLLQSRTPANVESIAVGSARQRLLVTRAGTGLEVVNGLGATIRTLTVRDAATSYALASPLAEGGRATLQAVGAVLPSLVDTLHPAALRFDAIARERRPGSYVAVLDRSPFVEAGVTDPEERDSAHVVLGFLERVP